MAFTLVADNFQERLNNQLITSTDSAKEILVDRTTENRQFLLQIALASANPHNGAPPVMDAVVYNDRPGLLQALDPYFRVALHDTALGIDRLIAFDAHGETLINFETLPATTTISATYITNTRQLHLAQTGLFQSMRQDMPEDPSGFSVGEVQAAILALPSETDSDVSYVILAIPIYGNQSPDEQHQFRGGLIIASQLEHLLEDARTT